MLLCYVPAPSFTNGSPTPLLNLHWAPRQEGSGRPGTQILTFGPARSRRGHPVGGTVPSLLQDGISASLGKPRCLDVAWVHVLARRSRTHLVWLDQRLHSVHHERRSKRPEFMGLFASLGPGVRPSTEEIRTELLREKNSTSPRTPRAH